ncbi:MAG: GTP-binding protein [Bacteroidetes bacterium]|nr:MAG: GTP-binding protein [Bacteroidota bacterium]
MSNIPKIINIGIVAHVDAGKTSITEQFLFKSGAIRKLGSVDKGTSQSDSLAVEKERGISVRSASASFEWTDIKINLIDTPGHVDFSAEVERSLRALDCAILVLSAVEGVQAHADTLWKALRIIDIPILIFINKIDRAGSDTDSVIREIKKELSPDIVNLNAVQDEGTNEAGIIDLIGANSFDGLDTEFIESVLNNDESLMESYLNNEDITIEHLQKSITQQFLDKKLFLVLFGSAKYAIGINELLDAITQYMPIAKGDPSAAVSGIVYKVEHDKTIGKIASVRLFNGTLKNRDMVFNASRNKEEKISQIRKIQGNKWEDIGILSAGDTGALCGLSSIKAGDIIGITDEIHTPVSLNTPLLTVKISPQKTEDYSSLVKAMQILMDEDPTFDLIWLKEERELHIKIMGLIQVEILESVLNDRFDLKVEFDHPSVIYKETPAATGEAYEEYTMPKPCWAVVRFKIEPGERGSGVVYYSEIGVNQIAKRYQQEIERTLPLALKQGIHGWEITDLKITLIGGEHHNIHSRAGDFAVATPMAILNGLKTTGSILLEPMLDYTVTGPEESLGKVIGGLTQLRAELSNPLLTEGKFKLSGTIPVATSLDYAAKLSAITGGKGKLSTRFSVYRECPVELGTTIPFRGISPLDRAKYILKARKAIK